MSEVPLAVAERQYAPEVYIQRNVTRLVDRTKHRKGMNVANFMGDLEDMLSDGEFYGLTPSDFNILSHLHRAGVYPADNAEGGVVSLSGRQWGRFVGVRRTYLAAKRVPQNLINHLRATRAAS